MFWDDLVRRWRRDARGVDPRLLRAAAGHVAVLLQGADGVHACHGSSSSCCSWR
jgi:hypothetical protein